MTPLEAARIYVDLVRLEEALSQEDWRARQEVTILRSKYHDLFSDVLRQVGVICADRFEATRRAFDLVEEASSPPLPKRTRV